MYNDRAFVFGYDIITSYDKMVSTRDSMTIIIIVSKGRQLIIEALMLIFTYSNGNYFIDALDDRI